MKLRKMKSPFGSLIVAALLVSLPFLCSEAQAQARRWLAAALAAAVSAGAADMPLAPGAAPWR